MAEERITIEHMIVEGSITARWAMVNGYRWDCVVMLGDGDAGKIRAAWLARQEAAP